MQHRAAVHASAPQSGEKQLEWLDPDAVLERASAMHLCDNGRHGHHRTNREFELAARVASEFVNLEADRQEDRRYLSNIQATVHSFLSQLGALAHDFADELADATNEFDASQEDILKQRHLQEGFKVIQFLWPLTVYGAVGVGVAQVIGRFLPHYVAATTGEFWPTFLGAVLSIGILGFGRQQLFEMRRTHAHAHLQYRKSMARRFFEKARAELYDTHRTRLIEHWKEYTGKDYSRISGFRLIIEDERLISEAYRRNLHPRRSLTRQFGLRVLSLFSRRKKRPQKKE